MILMSASAAVFAASLALFLSTFDFPVPAVALLVQVITAVGTLTATGVAVWLAAKAAKADRDAVARVVTAWATEKYTPNASTSSYHRRVVVHVANESNEPVYDARVSVVIGEGVTLGPLSAPPSIVVLPPRRELRFDISVPLLAHENAYNPRVELLFTDPKGRRWSRDSEGRLTDITNAQVTWTPLDPENELAAAQMGKMSEFANPMAVVLLFLHLLRLDKSAFDADDMAEKVLAPEAAGWATADWDFLREDFADFQPTSMVDFPAPHIARVKLSGDAVLQGMQVSGSNGMALPDLRFITLTMTFERGWRVWGMGQGVAPDEIQFPAGTFDYLAGENA